MNELECDSLKRRSGRERILDAAIACFSEAPYAEVSLRDLAAAAEVDVAYVHRSYGSKNEIFKAAVIELMQVDQLLAQPSTPGEMIERLIANVTHQCSEIGENVRTLDLVLRSCTSAQPREILQEAVEQQFIAPLSAAFGKDQELTVSFIMSFLLGVAIMREALEVEPLASLSPERLRALSSRILHGMLETTQPAGK